MSKSIRLIGLAFGAVGILVQPVLAEGEASVPTPSAAQATVSVTAEPAAASEDVRSAEQTITIFTDALMQSVDSENRPSFDERTAIMYEAVAAAFDLRFIARATVGRLSWDDWSDEQKEVYTELLQQYQASVLASRFEPGASPKFIIEKVTDAPRNTKIVSTRIERSDKDAVSIDYRMVNRDGIWLVADIYLDSRISEVAVRRSEYSATLRAEGYDGLIVAIRSQIETIRQDKQAEEAASDVSEEPGEETADAASEATTESTSETPTDAS